MFTVALFIMAKTKNIKTQKQPKCMSTEQIFKKTLNNKVLCTIE